MIYYSGKHKSERVAWTRPRCEDKESASRIETLGRDYAGGEVTTALYFAAAHKGGGGGREGG